MSADYTEDTIAPSPVFSDIELAERFATRHAGELRYVAPWGQWMRFEGRCWREENTLWAFDRARAICREAANEANKGEKSIASAKTVAAVEKLARADRRLAATIDAWDTDPWLLNTPDCVVDLRTGKRRGHSPEDYMTKMTAVSPGGDCPQWRKHLETILGGDAELIGFLQRSLGYSLTGITREHALFFGHGSGANGKGTTLETVAYLMGDYARTAPMEVFTYSSTDRHPTELAMLRGARLVTASETEEGRGWAESKIKAMTGGDRITARFMRQDFFEFVPQFKIWLTGNHKPSLRSVDESIRRRFNLVPFAVTIPAGERDKDLPAKLRDEGPGILAWMIEGCVAWQKEGLKAPGAVTNATKDYLDAEDALGLWFAECCVIDKTCGELTSRLYDSFKRWAEAAGEPHRSMRKFSLALEARSRELGIEKHPNGFLPRNLIESTDPIVFTEESFADQLLQINQNMEHYLTNYFGTKTCLLIGLSLNDPVLKHLLRRSATANPGQCHYYVCFYDSEKINDDARLAIINANFQVYNLVTLFLNREEIAAIGSLVSMDEEELRQCAEELEINLKYVFYVTGPMGVGKSTCLANLYSVTTFDEWSQERLPELAKDRHRLKPHEDAHIRDWLGEEFYLKNWKLSESRIGIHLVDRPPLDPLAFTNRTQWAQRAAEQLAKIVRSPAAHPIQSGHVILLLGDPGELQGRIIAQNKLSAKSTLEENQLYLREIYDDPHSVTKIDTRTLTVTEVVHQLASIIHLAPYNPADLQARLLHFADPEQRQFDFGEQLK